MTAADVRVESGLEVRSPYTERAKQTSDSVLPAAGDASELECVLARELAKATDRVEVITSIIGGWVWETDSEHRFVYMSPSVERYAGRKPEWHYGKTRQELGNMNLHTIDGGSWLLQLQTRARFGPVDFIRYQDGSSLLMRTIGHPRFDETGRFTGYIGVAFELPADAKSELAERRSGGRKRIVRAAEVTSEEGVSVACVLVDFSPTGARLRLPEGVKLSRRLHLSVPALSLTCHAELRWQRRNEIGVQFSR